MHVAVLAHTGFQKKRKDGKQLTYANCHAGINLCSCSQDLVKKEKSTTTR